MPVIEIRQEGDLFNCGADVLVIPVNCVGVPGKGLAKEFAQRYPLAAAEYKSMCKPTEGWRPGSTHIVGADDDSMGVDHIILFPTKDHWRQPSQLKWIAEGLEDLVDTFDPAEDDFKVNVMAVPALGCGEGGLNWKEVEPLIVGTLRKVVRASRIIVFPPRPQ
jgi:O-acetyl-ADP-ribose deacetylase (regulator of RNase III)